VADVWRQGVLLAVTQRLQQCLTSDARLSASDWPLQDVLYGTKCVVHSRMQQQHCRLTQYLLIYFNTSCNKG
jgi:hypothetical protein